MITRKINKINHPIYSSIDEFRKDNPNLLLVNNWREGTEGSWVVSDDGQVCEVLKRGTMLRRAGSKQKTITLGFLSERLYAVIILKWKVSLEETFILLA